ncbi:MAG: CoA pyrophosphatase [Pseudomonadales bacterium]
MSNAAHLSLEKIATYKAKKLLGRRYMARAAVTMILRESRTNNAVAGSFDVLMMRRADRKGDPWSGHMAFPGGKMDSVDESTFETSLRELAEETGIPSPATTLESVGRLSDVLTRNHSGKRPMAVTPFVFHLVEDVEFNPNHEVAELIWVPVDYIRNASHRETMHWEFKGATINLPCYFYEGRRIWGLSLTMLDELLKLLYNQKFKDTHSRLQFSPRGNWITRSWERWKR